MTNQAKPPHLPPTSKATEALSLRVLAFTNAIVSLRALSSLTVILIPQSREKDL